MRPEHTTDVASLLGKRLHCLPQSRIGRNILSVDSKPETRAGIVNSSFSLLPLVTINIQLQFWWVDELIFMV